MGATKAVLFLTAAGIALAQPAATAPANPAGDGLAVRLLQKLAPALPGTLTEKERFRVYVADTVGIMPLASSTVSAALSLGIDSPVEWGQDWGGYGQRLAHKLGKNAVRRSITYLTSAALREDNRYFASEKDTVAGRLAHALISPVTTRLPSGRTSISFSSLAGVIGASAISRAWVPPSWRGADNVAASVGITLATSAGVDVLREFVPDLIRALRRR